MTAIDSKTGETDVDNMYVGVYEYDDVDVVLPDEMTTDSARAQAPELLLGVYAAPGFPQNSLSHSWIRRLIARAANSPMWIPEGPSSFGRFYADLLKTGGRRAGGIGTDSRVTREESRKEVVGGVPHAR